LRSNAPPGGCGCINLNGGSATFAWPIKPGGALALVGDITAAHAGSISSTGKSLTLSSYTAGAHYRLKLGHSPNSSSWQPFGQALIGLAHSSGTLGSRAELFDRQRRISLRRQSRWWRRLAGQPALLR
jgi:peptidoglycan-associated lipoprotein